MDEMPVAHSPDEVRYYLMVTACPHCGKGPWIIEEGPQGDAGRPAISVKARCKCCSTVRQFAFACDNPSAPGGDQEERINPTVSPSSIIDLVQWLSLFYLLVESASAETSPPAVRRLGYQAALCLAEALKFYGDNELPPESAFFSPPSLDAFRAHPENFARQKLRDMQAKLPALPVMARRIERDHHPVRRRWWRFWQRRENR